MNQSLKGSLLTLIAGMSWGISGVSGQYLMVHGVHVNLLTSLRLIIAGLILTVIAYLSDKEKLKAILSSKSDMLGIALFALMGLMLNQYAYLNAIQHTNAGTATVLQYVTPVLVLIYTCLRRRVAPTVIEVVSIILAMGGTFIMATHGNLTELAITPIGLFWGIVSAFTYSAYLLIPVKLIQKWGSLHVIGIGMLLGGLVFPLVTRAWHYSFAATGMNFLALFGIVGIGTIFAYTVFLQGVSMIGAVEGSLLASVEPVASVILTVVLMGTQFYTSDFLGMLCIISAVLLISLKDLLASQKAEMKN